MDAALRRLVRQRADERCEYCRIPQSALDATLQIEHIVAQQHGGVTQEWNLGLACDRCNLQKGPNLSRIDPDTGQIVGLFHPRQQSWEEHFQFRGPLVIGLTPTGRATVAVLKMNEGRRVHLRSQLQAAGEM
jgi:hypothetical protein